MCVTITSVLSHLVVRTQHFWKIKEKKIEKKINIDLAIIASQCLKRRFMTFSLSEVLLKNSFGTLYLLVLEQIKDIT